MNTYVIRGVGGGGIWRWRAVPAVSTASILGRSERNVIRSPWCARAKVERVDQSRSRSGLIGRFE